MMLVIEKCVNQQHAEIIFYYIKVCYYRVLSFFEGQRNCSKNKATKLFDFEVVYHRTICQNIQLPRSF